MKNVDQLPQKFLRLLQRSAKALKPLIIRLSKESEVSDLSCRFWA